MKEKIAIIHQPDFFPWLGVFDKIFRCDIFVILDHVVNRPNDGIYTKRVKIVINKSAEWISVPLIKPKGVEFVPINRMEIQCSDKRSLNKINKTLYTNYKRAPYFSSVFPLVEDYFSDSSVFIAERNMRFINKVCHMLNIQRTAIRSSTLECSQASTELLIEICKKVSATAYMCGGGAKNYQEDEKICAHGIKLIYQNFQHPVYPQFNTENFIPGLSIIDALMNCGFQGVKLLLESRIIC